MKKVLSFILAALMLPGILSVCALADASVSVSDETAAPGDTVVVKVSLADRFMAAALTYEYDEERLTLDSVSVDGALSTDEIIYDSLASGVLEVNYTDNKIVYVAPEDVSGDAFLELTFTVDEKARGSASVSVSGVEAADSSESFVLQNGTAAGTVTIRSGIPGDVNFDGLVTAADAMFVLQSVEGTLDEELAEELDLASGDVTGEGSTTADDAMLILQYVADPSVAFPAAASR